ncbi:endoplasmic reticulum-Golgi intermediate compartment protein 1-like [Oncorhynchus masou masou]|uniref:endoplasmic reticulum-Golgi intermediate compartment protein 1-like n=1 Tax=Oncorhynchus masou masou TaxID=90313 RepID=UPI0031835256
MDMVVASRESSLLTKYQVTSTCRPTAQPQSPDMTHLIHELAFGEKLLEYVAYSHTGRIIPAIWFRYDLGPITVKYTEKRQPLYRFITMICAIIGGRSR